MDRRQEGDKSALHFMVAGCALLLFVTALYWPAGWAIFQVFPDSGYGGLVVLWGVCGLGLLAGFICIITAFVLYFSTRRGP